MWTRLELKTNAKNQMKNRYFSYLGISLLPQLASYIVQTPITVIAIIVMIINIGTNTNMQFLYIFIMIPILISTWFLINPVIIGMYKWYLRAGEQQNPPLAITINIFKKGNYIKTVGSFIYMNLFVCLWSLLLIIPGIIKYYAYSMVPMILADNPQIGAKKALKLSCGMTKGHKLNMFILDLSFLGWYILGLFLLIVGYYAVVPYYYAVRCELYNKLKMNAVANGLCTMEELGYTIKEGEQPS